ncbi:MAG: redoxin family protein [Crocinitomicaceae bacterium]|jgi:thioredoxin-related protein
MSFSRKKIHLVKLSALFVLIPALYLFSSSFLPSGYNGLNLGDRMPMSNLNMMGVSETGYSLESLKKRKGLIVVFSCNTCPFVVGNDNFEGWEKQYDNLNKLASKKEIGFVLVNSNEGKRDGNDSFEEMIKHAKKARYEMPYVVDEKSKLADAFGAKTTPHVFVFDKNDALVYKGSIDNVWDSKRTKTIPYLVNVMDYLAGDSTLIESITPPRGCSIKRKK